MKKIKASYWKVKEDTYKLQIQTKEEQKDIQKMLPGWQCVSFVYVPSTSEEILVFEKSFKSEIDWTKFLNSDMIIEKVEMRDINE